MQSTFSRQRYPFEIHAMKLLLLAFSLLSVVTHAAQYAVIATINDYQGEASDLRGCNNDGDAFQQLLMQRFGFPKENILRLRDSEVTAEAVTRALSEHLVAKTQPGDAAVFFYSGHGTQVPDFDGDERDQADEAICVHDMEPADPATWITDDVLRHHLSQIQSNRVTVLLECCHSGTGTRGLQSDAAGGVRYLDLGFGRSQEMYRNLSVSTGMKAPTNNPQHVLLSACASHELAREVGPAGGFFRLALEQAIADSPLDTPLEKLQGTVQGFIDALMARTANPRKQTPQIEGNARVSLLDLLAAEVPAGSPLAQPPVPLPPVPVPDAGSLVGDVGITLATDKKDYLAGEAMAVTLTLSKDAHLRLYYTDAEQRSFLIFPNKFHPDDFVKAGEKITLPAAGAAFAFEMTYPVDRGHEPVSEVLTAVASAKPFEDTRSLQWQAANFIECTGQNYQEMVTRGIAVKEQPQVGRATAIYQVRPKP